MSLHRSNGGYQTAPDRNANWTDHSGATESQISIFSRPPGWMEAWCQPLYYQVGGLIAIAGFCLLIGVSIGKAQSNTIIEQRDGLSPWLPQDISPSFTAFHMTDAHIEPWYDKRQVQKGNCRNPDCCRSLDCEAFEYRRDEPPTLGCDPPISLLEGALNAMKAIDPAAAYLLYTGDMPAHHICSEDIVRATQAEFLRTISHSMPQISFFYAIGNNDLWPNSQNSRYNFKALYTLIEENCPNCALLLGPQADMNKKTFQSGGYYMHRDQQRRTTVLVLNSGLWCPRYDNSNLPRELPDNHMDWTEAQLQAVRERQDKVVIMSHVPPGYVRLKQDWEQRYLDRYLNICAEYKDVILGQFFGHHSKEYIRSFNEDVGVLVSAGLTPLGGGSLETPGSKDAANPTFRHATFTRDGFYDLWVFYMDLSAGDRGQVNQNRLHEEELVSQVDTVFSRAVRAARKHGWDYMYSFREAYKVSNVSAASIHTASQRILHDSHYTARYESFLGGLHSNYRMLVCDIRSKSLKSQELERCFDRLCVYDVSQQCQSHNSR